jgi:3-oxo-5alpha-steroid 4-dehydrogenase
MSSEPKMTRRELIKGTAAGAVAVTATGAFSGCSPTAPSNLPQTWDRETDVVVVGLGGAGAATAIEAARAGAEVIVLERTPVGGGSTVLCGGLLYMGGGTPLQKATGFEDSVENMYNYMLAAVGEGADPEMIRIYCENSVDLYDWLVQLGVPFKESYIPGKYAAVPTDDGLAYTGNEMQAAYKAVATPAPRGHHVEGIDHTGKVLFPPLQAGAEAAGAEITYEAPARRLVVNPEGRVVGVVIDIDGVEEFIKARKGVVLCAGGFAANKEMVAQHCPQYLRSEFLVGTKTDDGIGIRIGQGVGGDVRMMGDAFAYSGIYEFGESLVKGILVDQKGRRFIGEDNYGSWVGRALIQGHPVSYVIVNQAIWDEVPEQGKTYIQEHIKFGGQADTIAELSRAASINTAVLENTVNFYNEHASRGEDPEFSKDPHYLVPLEKGPFYAINFPAAYAWFFTTGGLKTTGKAEVLDVFGEPVPGLYAAGRNAFAVCATMYPGSGTSVCEALTFGRIAGRVVASLEAWS